MSSGTRKNRSHRASGLTRLMALGVGAIIVADYFKKPTDPKKPVRAFRGIPTGPHLAALALSAHVLSARHGANG